MNTRNAENTDSSGPTWEQAWARSTFWSRHRPDAHFHTLSTSTDLIARALTRITVEHDLTRIIDIGAGSGHLLAACHRLQPALESLGIDQRRGPEAPFRWVRATWRTCRGWDVDLSGHFAHPALIVAHEWLDDLPAAVVRRTGRVWRHRCPGAHPDSGPDVTEAEAQWLASWWDAGSTDAEIGSHRDRAWGEIVGLAAPGSVLVVIDYGHRRGDRRPTFVAHRGGAMLDPDSVPPADLDRVNLTAHVAIDAVDHAARAAGAVHVACTRVRDVIDQLAPLEADPLTRLAERSERALLAAPGGPGDFWWLTHRIPT